MQIKENHLKVLLLKENRLTVSCPARTVLACGGNVVAEVIPCTYTVITFEIYAGESVTSLVAVLFGWRKTSSGFVPRRGNKQEMAFLCLLMLEKLRCCVQLIQIALFLHRVEEVAVGDSLHFANVIEFRCLFECLVL